MSNAREWLIPPASGRRIELARSETLRIVDVEGGQVADLMALAAGDPGEWLSSGRTFDYGRTIYPTTGSTLYSNRSRPLLTITADTAGRHDFLFAPCSQEMFAIEYGITEPHPSCLANLAACFEPEGFAEDRMPTPFNVFMQVDVEPASGRLTFRAPSSAAGDAIELRAETDLVVGVTACAAPNANAGRLKPVRVEVRGPVAESPPGRG